MLASSLFKFDWVFCLEDSLRCAFTLCVYACYILPCFLLIKLFHFYYWYSQVQFCMQLKLIICTCLCDQLGSLKNRSSAKRMSHGYLAPRWKKREQLLIIWFFRQAWRPLESYIMRQSRTLWRMWVFSKIANLRQVQFTLMCNFCQMLGLLQNSSGQRFKHYEMSTCDSHWKNVLLYLRNIAQL